MPCRGLVGAIRVGLRSEAQFLGRGFRLTASTTYDELDRLTSATAAPPKARYYGGVVGRFISPDPMGVDPKTGGNFNRYWYANNNPYKYTDPDGRLADTILDIGFVAYSTYAFITEPSWTNAAALGADVVGAVVPFATGLGAGVRAANAGADVAHGVDAARATDAAADSAGKLYHYTDAAGAQGVQDSGEILPGADGRVYLTTDKVSAEDASNALFMGRGGDKGSHVVEVDVRSGVQLQPGTQPNELIHEGAIREGRQATLRVREND